MVASSQSTSTLLTLSSSEIPLLLRLKRLTLPLHELTFPELFFNRVGQAKRQLTSAEQFDLEAVDPGLREEYLNDSRSSAPRRCFALLRGEELLLFAVTPERLITMGSRSASTDDLSLFVSCDPPLIKRLFPAPLWGEVAALDPSEELLIAEYSPMGALRSWVEVGKEETLLAPLIETFPELREAVDLNARDSRRRTALHRAVLTGKVETATALIRAGAERDPKELDGKSPLHLAASQGNLPMVEALLSLGCDPLALTSEQENLLHFAISKGTLPLTLFLLEHLSASNWLAQGDSDGKTPLHRAVWGDPKPELVDRLLQAGADPNRPSLYGYTPLHWAAKHGHFESGQLLLTAGARIDQLNANGETPVDLALRFDQGAMVWQLLGGESSQFFQTMALSSAASSSSSSAASSSDPRGALYAAFEAAHEEGKLLPQIYWLEKLGELLINLGEYIQAAHCLNGALSLILANPSGFDGREEILKNLILTQLEKIEGLLLWDLFEQKSPASHRGYLIPYRSQLQSARAQFADELRSEVAIEQAQASLTRGYIALLISLIEESITLIGQGAPFGFAVIGLGSMARMEMCPYSDLEFAFLIDNPSPGRLDYFRKLSGLLTLKMVNMGETKCSLIRFKRGRGGAEDRLEKSLVSTGFSLDIGGLCPTGKRGVYELIGTPQQLALFQTAEWLRQNDGEIILVNALTLSSYLIGDQALVDSYRKEVDQILNKDTGAWLPWSRKKLRQERALELMGGFVDEFDPKIDQHKVDLRAFDVKKELYRLPQTIVSGLALYYGLEGTNTLERIEGLRRIGALSEEGARRLARVFQSILKLRAETHLFYKTEREILYHPRAQEAEGERLLLISPEIREQLLECYRTLIPLHEGAQAFLAGDPKPLSHSSLYIASIGTYDDRLREGLDYDGALRAAQETAAFNPDISSKHSLGLVHLDMGQAQRALESFEEALLLLKREHGDRPHPDVAMSLSSLGGSYYTLGETQRAIDYEEQSLTMYKLIHGDQPHPNIANSFGKLGLACNELGESQRAIDYLEQSLAMNKLIYGDRPHPDVATSLNNLGNALDDLGETQRAIEYYQQSLTIYKQIHGDRPHPDVAMSLNNLGEAYRGLGETQRAIEYYQQSLAIYKQIHGDRPNPHVANSLNNFGAAYSYLGQTRRAIGYWEQSLKMNKLIHGDGPHPDIAMSLNNLGDAYRSLGETQRAIEYCQQSLAIYKQIHGDRPHPDVAMSLNNLGNAWGQLGETQRAIDYQEQSLGMYKLIHGDRPHPQAAISLANLGNNYLKLGNCSKSIELLQSAYEILLKTAGAEHPHAKWTKERLDAAIRGQTSSPSTSITTIPYCSIN